MIVRVMSELLQPPPTAEELALKDQVTQVLTSQGVLAKIKAELRAAVFEVMHEREGFAKQKDFTVLKLGDFPIETRTTALSLILECLQFFQWENTLRVLLAEANAENEQYDTSQLASKLGLASTSSLKMPTLFQLIESQVVQVDKTTSKLTTTPVSTSNHNQFDDEDDEEDTQGALERTAKPAEQEKVEHPLPSTELERTETETSKSELKDEDDQEEGESSAEIEESMVEEVPSGSEMEESNYTNYEDEESHDHSTNDSKQPSIQTPQEEAPHDKKQQQHFDERESDDEDAVSLEAPPPAPSKLPALPPLVSTPEISRAEDAEDDFDAEEEADRLRKLDAALQAMEAEDDTGTLQQLKASLQVELQEQDSFGGGRADDEDDAEAETSKAGDSCGGDDYGYGSSDFEEEEDISSEISEEMESMMESMPEPSDKEDESQDGAGVSAAKVEPPHALRNDTRVDSEDALNSYDYIEDVEKSGW